jgi:hypothetical protein
LLLLSGAAAHAASITNRDEVDRKVTIIEGERTTEHVLQPSQALNDVCAKGCTIRLDDDEDDEYILEPGDEVAIEDGSLYYDRPDTPTPPATPPPGGGRAGGKG